MSDQNKDMGINQESLETEEPVQVDYAQGKKLRESGDDTQAASCFHNALMSYEQDGDEKGVANASAQLGDICAVRAEHEKAIAHYQRAYEICDKENDSFSLIALQKKMVISKRALKQYDEAIRIYLNVIDIYSGCNNPSGTVAIMEELAKFYLEIGERQKAADTYRTIASIHKNFSHTLQAKEFTDKAAQVEQGGV